MELFSSNNQTTHYAHTQVWPKSSQAVQCFPQVWRHTNSQERVSSNVTQGTWEGRRAADMLLPSLLFPPWPLSALTRASHTLAPSLRWWLFIFRVFLWWVIFIFILIFTESSGSFFGNRTPGLVKKILDKEVPWGSALRCEPRYALSWTLPTSSHSQLSQVRLQIPGHNST